MRNSSAGVPPAVARASRPRRVTLASRHVLNRPARCYPPPPAEKHLSVYSVAANYSLRRSFNAKATTTSACSNSWSRSAKSAPNPTATLAPPLQQHRRRFPDRKITRPRAGTRRRPRRQVSHGKWRGLVPIAALGSLLPRILGGPVTLHEESGRLFIGNFATHFTASLAGRQFSPTRPSLHRAGKSFHRDRARLLRMTFSRDPLVSPASPTLTFGKQEHSFRQRTAKPMAPP